MKKIFLNLFILSGLVLTTACSSDDDGGNAGTSGQIVATIDGQSLTFDTIVVDVDKYTDEGVAYTDLDVTATIGGDTSKIIEFGVEQGDTGEDVTYYFSYTVDGIEYYDSSNDFNTNVTVNNGSKITINFSGNLSDFTENGQVSVIVESGIVNVNY